MVFWTDCYRNTPLCYQINMCLSYPVSYKFYVACQKIDIWLYWPQTIITNNNKNLYEHKISTINLLWLFFFYTHRFSKRYELPLVVQSIVMNITMFLMIHLCIKVKRNNAILEAKERVFSGKKITYFISRLTKIFILTISKIVWIYWFFFHHPFSWNFI